MGIIRNHYVGRTFIEPEQGIRDFGVRIKLNPARSAIEGKRIVLVDGNPLEDIGAALNVKHVIANGRSYTLEELLKDRQP